MHLQILVRIGLICQLSTFPASRDPQGEGSPPGLLAQGSLCRQEGSLPLTCGGEDPSIKAVPTCRSKPGGAGEGQSSISPVFKKNKPESCGTILVITFFILPKKCCLLGWQHKLVSVVCCTPRSCSVQCGRWLWYSE